MSTRFTVVGASSGPVDPTLTMPPPGLVDQAGYEEMRAILSRGRIVLLTGAGMSTASGIPDYRGPDGTRRVQPMQHSEFVGSAQARQRYWARAFLGWETFAAARPNGAHRAVADLERTGLTSGVITQNVDGLHQKAGARQVLELHGSLNVVECLTCGERYRRQHVQEWLTQANPEVGKETIAAREVRPDGDVVVAEDIVRRFRAPRCLVCGEDVLKPDVVFFGGSVPKPVVQQAYEWVEAAGSILVLGSSLQVMSGYRFIRRAHREGIPVCIITRGPTRGFAETTVHLDTLLTQVLPQMVHDLTMNEL